MSAEAVSQRDGNQYELDNPFWPKPLMSLPIVGPFVQMIFENMVGLKASMLPAAPENKDKLIKIIELRNQYKMIGVVREILTTAAIVTLVALSIFSLGSILPAIILAGLAGRGIYLYTLNTEVIKDVRSNGYTPGILIH